MKGRHLVGAAVGAVGAAAAGNRLIARRVEPLGPPLERETGSYRWRGMNISYTEGGDPEAPDMVLAHRLHRVGTSREFDRIFERLADEYHVFAPDLPGFGRSDRPPLTYSATLYETFLQDFIQDLTERPLAIGSGLSGGYLVAAATEVELDGLVLICPTSRAHTRSSRAYSTLLRSPIVGPTTFNVMTSRRALARSSRNLVHDPEVLSEHDVRYFWETAHQPGARYAPASLIAGELDATVEIGHTLADLDLDTTLIWGREATDPPLRTGRSIANESDVKLIVLDQSRTLPHLEQPGPFHDLLEEELATPS